MRAAACLALVVIVGSQVTIADDDGWEYWLAEDRDTRYSSLELLEVAIRNKGVDYSVLELAETRQHNDTFKSLYYRAPLVEPEPGPAFEVHANYSYPSSESTGRSSGIRFFEEAEQRLRDGLIERQYWSDGPAPSEFITLQTINGEQYWFYGEAIPYPITLVPPQEPFWLTCNDVTPGQAIAYLKPGSLQYYHPRPKRSSRPLGLPFPW